MKENEKLMKIFKKDLKVKYKVYHKVIYHIKNEYRYKLKNNLESINKEKERLELELDCIKSSKLQYVLPIGTFAIGATLNNMKMLNNILMFRITVFVCILTMVGLCIIVINDERKERTYKYALKALKELEEEITQEEIEKINLKVLENIN
ncbi:hypothetical protein [Clostridium senegalense]|uniref:hypothetical protein n=1 Tax=Clostridium senegalense TaxID=1465809 RepID=UPI000288DDD4|nr:hypothetical protein [Clostridium senegalense]